MLRMFVAVVPPAHAREHLAEAVEGCRPDGSGLRWTDAGDWHLTLAFLAAVPEHAVGPLTERLGRAAARRTVVEASVRGAGAFPRPRDARVLWAGVSTAGQELRLLASACRAAARRAGVDVPDRRFRPHLTLARSARPADLTAVVDGLATYEGPSWPVERVRLVASRLGAGHGGRPLHETVAEVGVGSRWLRPPAPSRPPGRP